MQIGFSNPWPRCRDDEAFSSVSKKSTPVSAGESRSQAVWMLPSPNNQPPDLPRINIPPKSGTGKRFMHQLPMLGRGLPKQLGKIVILQNPEFGLGVCFVPCGYVPNSNTIRARLVGARRFFAKTVEESHNSTLPLQPYELHEVIWGNIKRTIGWVIKGDTRSL